MSRREKNVPFCILRFSRFFPSLNSGEGGGAWKKLKRCGGTFFFARTGHACVYNSSGASFGHDRICPWLATYRFNFEIGGARGELKKMMISFCSTPFYVYPMQSTLLATVAALGAPGKRNVREFKKTTDTKFLPNLTK